MVTTWIVAMLIPSTSIKLHGLEKFRRRFVKEFCWTLFGNLFVFEIVIFIYLGFSKEIVPTMLAGEYGTLLSVLLTFPATWQYRKGDHDNAEKTPQNR